jgi:glycosyltransferase involved in cell wall biosynthesis
MNISIVIPTVNSGKIIKNNINSLDDFLKKSKLINKYEIIVSAQTSDDNTFDVLKKIKKAKPLFIKQRGKGLGLTLGMKNAKYPWILMIDDDLPYNLYNFFNEAKNNLNADIIIGSRYTKKIKHDNPLKRRIASYGYRKLVSVLFSIPQKDIQAGIKLIRKDIFQKIKFPKQKGYIWDTELLFKANKKRLKIVEIPIFLKQVDNQLRIRKVIPKMLKDILTLWFKERILKYD